MTADLATALAAQMDALRDAMAAGDWDIVRTVYGMLKESAGDPGVDNLIAWLEIEMKFAHLHLGLLTTAEIAELSRDRDLMEAVLLMGESANKRFELEPKMQKITHGSDEARRKRWESEAQAVQYKEAIELAKKLMTSPTTTRDDILTRAAKLECVKHFGRTQLARMLWDNKALPPAKRRRDND